MKVLSSSRILCAKTLCVLVLLVYCTFVCDGVCPEKALIPVETRRSLANAVYHGVVLNISKELHTMDMALVSIYKGGTTFASISPYVGSPYNTTDRQITLKVPLDIADCYNWNIKPMNHLIVFSNVTYKPTSMPMSGVREGWLTANTQPLPWNPTLDYAMWKISGWSDWDEWTPCTKTCGGGNQLRVRFCRSPGFEPCEGFSEQRRTCNTFSCEGTINPLAPDFRKNFHPTQAQWDSIPERPHAFSLNPNSYIWISSSELFVPGKSFPKEFTIFLSLRLRTKSAGHGQGTLFALRSRRKTDSYLSLELIGYGAARLVHTGEGETKSIHLAVPLFDFRWHSIAVSVHDDNTVRAYVDCKWLRTDVLQKNALVTPRDADIIIGYLYSGDLEQLSIVPRAGEANHQCSTQITEIPYI